MVVIVGPQAAIAAAVSGTRQDLRLSSLLPRLQMAASGLPGNNTASPNSMKALGLPTRATPAPPRSSGTPNHSHFANRNGNGVHHSSVAERQIASAS